MNRVPYSAFGKGPKWHFSIEIWEEINLAITELGQSEFQHLVKFVNHNLQVTHVM